MHQRQIREATTRVQLQICGPRTRQRPTAENDNQRERSQPAILPLSREEIDSAARLINRLPARRELGRLQIEEPQRLTGPGHVRWPAE